MGLEEMMRMGEDGQLRPLYSHEVAQMDQVLASHSGLLNTLISLTIRTEEAVKDGDSEAAVETSNQVGAAIWGQFPDASPEVCSFIMFAVTTLRSAIEYTQNARTLADVMVRSLPLLLPPEHPIHQLPGLDIASSLEVLRRVSEEQRGETYTTGTGVKLTKVHPLEMCDGEFCVIHNPAPGPWQAWPTHWEEDEDGRGRMFRVCPHDKLHLAVEEEMRNPFWLVLMEQEAHELHEHGCDCVCDLARCELLYQDGKIVGFKAKEN